MLIFTYIRGDFAGLRYKAIRRETTERLQIALELKQEGLPFKFIAKTTKLTIEEIEKL